MEANDSSQAAEMLLAVDRVQHEWPYANAWVFEHGIEEGERENRSRRVALLRKKLDFLALALAAVHEGRISLASLFRDGRFRAAHAEFFSEMRESSLLRFLEQSREKTEEALNADAAPENILPSPHFHPEYYGADEILTHTEALMLELETLIGPDPVHAPTVQALQYFFLGGEHFAELMTLKLDAVWLKHRMGPELWGKLCALVQQNPQALYAILGKNALANALHVALRHSVAMLDSEGSNPRERSIQKGILTEFYGSLPEELNYEAEALLFQIEMGRVFKNVSDVKEQSILMEAARFTKIRGDNERFTEMDWPHYFRLLDKHGESLLLSMMTAYLIEAASNHIEVIRTLDANLKKRMAILVKGEQTGPWSRIKRFFSAEKGFMDLSGEQKEQRLAAEMKNLIVHFQSLHALLQELNAYLGRKNMETHVDDYSDMSGLKRKLRHVPKINADYLRLVSEKTYASGAELHPNEPHPLDAMGADYRSRFFPPFTITNEAEDVGVENYRFRFKGWNFAGQPLKALKLHGIVFRECDFRNADLSDSIFWKSRFVLCRMENATLVNGHDLTSETFDDENAFAWGEMLEMNTTAVDFAKMHGMELVRTRFSDKEKARLERRLFAERNLLRDLGLLGGGDVKKRKDANAKSADADRTALIARLEHVGLLATLDSFSVERLSTSWLFDPQRFHPERSLPKIEKASHFYARVLGQIEAVKKDIWKWRIGEMMPAIAFSRDQKRAFVYDGEELLTIYLGLRIGGPILVKGQQHQSGGGGGSDKYRRSFSGSSSQW